MGKDIFLHGLAMQVYNAAGLQANVRTLEEDRALDAADGMVAGKGEGRRRKSQNSYAYLETSILAPAPQAPPSHP